MLMSIQVTILAFLGMTACIALLYSGATTLLQVYPTINWQGRADTQLGQLQTLTGASLATIGGIISTPVSAWLFFTFTIETKKDKKWIMPIKGR